MRDFAVFHSNCKRFPWADFTPRPRYLRYVKYFRGKIIFYEICVSATDLRKGAFCKTSKPLRSVKLDLCNNGIYGFNTSRTGKSFSGHTLDSLICLYTRRIRKQRSLIMIKFLPS